MNTGPLAGKTILFLETNMQIRQTVSGMLRVAGARDVLTATTARVALEMLASAALKIDLFLCAFMIDQGNGFVLMKAVRSGIGKVPRAVPCAMLCDGINERFTAIAGKLDIGFVFSLPIAGMKLATGLAATLRTPVQERAAADYQKIATDWAPSAPPPPAEEKTELTAREAALADSRKKAEAAEMKVEAGTIDQPVTLARDLRNSKGLMLAKAKEMVTPKAIARLIEKGMMAPEDTVFVTVVTEQQEA
jgi:CheY-like chemotaxis protein